MPLENFCLDSISFWTTDSNSILPTWILTLVSLSESTYMDWACSRWQVYSTISWSLWTTLTPWRSSVTCSRRSLISPMNWLRWHFWLSISYLALRSWRPMETRPCCRQLFSLSSLVSMSLICLTKRWVSLDCAQCRVIKPWCRWIVMIWCMISFPNNKWMHQM